MMRQRKNRDFSYNNHGLVIIVKNMECHLSIETEIGRIRWCHGQIITAVGFDPNGINRDNPNRSRAYIFSEAAKGFGEFFQRLDEWMCENECAAPEYIYGYTHERMYNFAKRFGFVADLENDYPKGRIMILAKFEDFRRKIEEILNSEFVNQIEERNSRPSNRIPQWKIFLRNIRNAAQDFVNYDPYLEG